jgi:hypothetical protein
MSPSEEDSVGTVDLQVPPTNVGAIDVQTELAAGSWVQHGSPSHPPGEQRGLREVLKDPLGLGIYVDRCDVGLSFHAVPPRRCLSGAANLMAISQIGSGLV